MYLSKGSSVDNNLIIQKAINVIHQNYGDTVSVSEKTKTLLKFGRNENVGTSPATIMALPSGISNETYVTGNTIDKVSSSNAGDTQTITIEGHTLSGGNLTFVTQTATLNGQNKVTLSTPLARCNRALNTGTTDIAGTVYFYVDGAITGGVPNTGSTVKLIIPAGQNQSQKAATSISSIDYWIITSYYASVLEKVSAIADIQLQIRELGKTFRTRANIGVSSESGLVRLDLDVPIIVPKNSDVRLVATASGTNIDISGGIVGYLALVL